MDGHPQIQKKAKPYPPPRHQGTEPETKDQEDKDRRDRRPGTTTIKHQPTNSNQTYRPTATTPETRTPTASTINTYYQLPTNQHQPISTPAPQHHQPQHLPHLPSPSASNTISPAPASTINYYQQSSIHHQHLHQPSNHHTSIHHHQRQLPIYPQPSASINHTSAGTEHPALLYHQPPHQPTHPSIYPSAPNTQQPQTSNILINPAIHPLIINHHTHQPASSYYPTSIYPAIYLSIYPAIYPTIQQPSAFNAQPPAPITIRPLPSVTVATYC
jgi:hypothetical protein